MKCDELKPLIFSIVDLAYVDEIRVTRNFQNPHDHAVYKATEVDEAIAELKAEIKRKETVGQRWFERCMEARTENVGLERAIWLARAERYKMKEFIAREEGNLSNQMSWSRVLRERTYNQWIDQLLRIANLANKLQNKCRAKAEEYKLARKNHAIKHSVLMDISAVIVAEIPLKN